MKKTIILITIGIILFGFLFYYLAWSLSPGSYARAETYELNVPEETLIEIINEVRVENEELDATSFFPDSKKKHWHSFYFQYEDKSLVIHTLTRPKNKTTTTFSFVGYKKRKDFGNWKAANEHFLWWKNSEAKNEFETKILKKIEDKIK